MGKLNSARRVRIMINFILLESRPGRGRLIFSWLWVVGFCCSFACVASLARGDDAQLRQRFQSEAPLKWKDLRVQFTNLRAEVSDSAEFPAAEDRPQSAHERQMISYNGRDNCLRYELKSFVGDSIGKEYIACLNDRYAFVATRRNADTPYLVRYLGTERDRIIADLQNHYAVFAGLMMHTVPIDLLFADSSCKVKEVTSVEIDGTACVRVEFQSGFAARENYVVLGGRVDLDPSRLWALRQFTMRVQHVDGIGFHSGNMDYHEGENGVLPKRLVHEVRHSADGPVRVRRKIDYRDVKAGDVECADCTMAAIGWPEPDFATARKRKLPVIFWMIGASLLFAGLAIGIRRWRSSPLGTQVN
jgi:hypothetical protein